MKIHFYKYQATGNDFVLIDNRTSNFSFSVDQIQKICDRKFGVGADGIMLIEKSNEFDFSLIYYNNDGTQSLCGNGSRAAVHFASSLGIINGHTSFNAYDGKHDADLLSNGTIRLKMNDVTQVETIGKDFSIYTGSPHYIKFVENIKGVLVFHEGRKVRYSDRYKNEGINVNFVELLPNNTLFVRTYERGVENETLSCGTGVTAAALAASLKGYHSPISIKTLGGNLSIEFKIGHSAGANPTFQEIFLIGPAKMVFEGHLEL